MSMWPRVSSPQVNRMLLRWHYRRRRACSPTDQSQSSAARKAPKQIARTLPAGQAGALPSPPTSHVKARTLSGAAPSATENVPVRRARAAASGCNAREWKGRRSKARGRRGKRTRFRHGGYGKVEGAGKLTHSRATQPCLRRLCDATTCAALWHGQVKCKAHGHAVGDIVARSDMLACATHMFTCRLAPSI